MLGSEMQTSAGVGSAETGTETTAGEASEETWLARLRLRMVAEANHHHQLKGVRARILKPEHPCRRHAGEGGTAMWGGAADRVKIKGTGGEEVTTMATALAAGVLTAGLGAVAVLVQGVEGDKG